MMHDWVISRIEIDWNEGVVDITFKTPFGDKNIVAIEFSEVNLPKREDWGPSNSVYKVGKPTQLENKNSKLSIEMQSGDVIVIEAKRIVLPCELEKKGE